MKYSIVILMLLLASCTNPTAPEPEYILHIDVRPANGGTVTVNQQHGLVTLEAIPTDGWMFFEWREDVTSRDSVIEFQLEEDTYIVALFIPVYGL